MMINLYNGLIKAAKILRVQHYIREDSAKATDILKFLEVLSLNRTTLLEGKHTTITKTGKHCSEDRNTCHVKKNYMS